MPYQQLPVPPHFDPERVGKVWKVPYQERAQEAENWARKYQIRPSMDDRYHLCLVLVDVQNTFCIPDFELFVGGRSGTGAVDDNRRLCEFIYRNLHVITQIAPTMDTHYPMQIFHPIFLVNKNEEHPQPFTLVSHEDIKEGRWRPNPHLFDGLKVDASVREDHLLHYTKALTEGNKYDLTIWPYHAMLGGIGHALVSSVEEAIFFHGIARISQPNFQIKGDNPLTEHYSVLGPEVLLDARGEKIAEKNTRLIEELLRFDAVIIAGQAKSHCVAWTIQDLLEDISLRDRGLAKKVYLLEDCTSPVVVPGVMDYTEQADEAFAKFAQAGMHIVSTTQPVGTWPGIKISD